MVEEVVVKETLSEEMISAGVELVRMLDDVKLVANAALWIYLPEANSWRFLVASPEVRSEGPKKIYRRIRSAIHRIPDEKPMIPLKDISVVDSRDRLITLLRSALRTGSSISGIRFSQNVINGVMIEDAYIYRLT